MAHSPENFIKGYRKQTIVSTFSEPSRASKKSTVMAKCKSAVIRQLQTDIYILSRLCRRVSWDELCMHRYRRNKDIHNSDNEGIFCFEGNVH